MKRIPILLIIIISSIYCNAQDGEFDIHSNGLMYSDTTMTQLRFIVDSLNLKFKSCELSKVYYSKSQAKAHYINLDKGNIKSAKQDMMNKIPFDTFINKYAPGTIEKDQLVVKWKYPNHQQKNVVEFSSIRLASGDTYEITVDENTDINNQNIQGTWIFDYWQGGEYSGESIRAYYFTTSFKSHPLMDEYARIVQYSNCMVDTTAQVFKADAGKYDRASDSKSPSEIKMFIRYINEATKRPEYEKNNVENYLIKSSTWDSLKWQHLNNVLSKKEKFQQLLKKAVTEGLESGNSNDEFEEYVGRYYSQEAALELKRSRIVIGGCSMDDRPRIHAMNIAVLSAKTVKWEIFLRAHLDIMNDRFERASDGSYAWAGRKTYIRELEELGINVSDLLLGISLRIENPGENHYYGSIRRIGRALSETRYAGEIENKMLTMIEDDRLDDYNRVLIFYLFLNYSHNIENEEKKADKLHKLKIATRKLPEYLASKVTLE